jgi:hypothetical protein
LIVLHGNNLLAFNFSSSDRERIARRGSVDYGPPPRKACEHRANRNGTGDRDQAEHAVHFGHHQEEDAEHEGDPKPHRGKQNGIMKTAL